MTSCWEKTDHAIIAGYGLPGRAAAEALAAQGHRYCVIELNPTTVSRCEKGHVPIIEGDCTEPEVLQSAGIDRAAMFVVMIPAEKSAVEATRQARRLNPTIRIITRCHYTSTGLEAKAAGADEVIVAEQVVAAEVSRFLTGSLASPHSRSPATH